MNPDNPKIELNPSTGELASTSTEIVLKVPDWLEHQTPERKTMIEVANALLVDAPVTEADSERTDAELGELIQERFQEALRNFYRTSGLADQIQVLRLNGEIQGGDEPLDTRACNLVARASEGVHGWVDMLPKLKQLNQASGMNCTLGSAMLHCALEDLGFTHVRTVLRAGHHVVMRALPDGGMTIYDATSLSTQHDELVGYTRTFSKDAVRNVQPVQEHGNRSGMAFTLVSAQRDSIGGFSAETGSQAYAQQFYGYDQSIIMDVAIALENLSEIKGDVMQTEVGAERYQQAQDLVQRFPQLQQLDFATTKQQFDLLDGYELVGERIRANAPEVNWERVSLVDELGELERTAEDLAIPLERLTVTFEHAVVETLSDADWEQTLNCDSSDTTWTFDDAREHLKGKRNFAAIVTGFNLGASMPTPVVLYRPGKPPYLIGGSSRLLGCRVMNKKPKVLALRLE